MATEKPTREQLLEQAVKAEEIAIFAYNHSLPGSTDIVIKSGDEPVQLLDLCAKLGTDPVALSRIFARMDETETPLDERTTVSTLDELRERLNLQPDAVNKHGRELAIGDKRGWAMLAELLGKDLRVVHVHTDNPCMGDIIYRATKHGSLFEKVVDLHPEPIPSMCWE